MSSSGFTKTTQTFRSVTVLKTEDNCSEQSHWSSLNIVRLKRFHKAQSLTQKSGSNWNSKTGLDCTEIRTLWWRQGVRFICRRMTWQRLKFSKKTKSSSKNTSFQLLKIEFCSTKLLIQSFTHTKSLRMRINLGFMIFKLLSTHQENTGFMLFLKKLYCTLNLFWFKNRSKKVRKLRKIMLRKRPNKKSVEEELNNRKKGSLKKS